MAANHLFDRDDGTRDVPGEDSEWSDWISATKCWNWCADDPLLDWLHHGTADGFRRDPEPDPRTDHGRFVMAKGQAFEAKVMAHLRKHHQVVDIAGRARENSAAERTWTAMAAGTEIIAQAVLWNPENQTYGMPDLLVRSDVLRKLFPAYLTAMEAAEPAPDLPSAAWHYRVLDVKYTTLHLLASGHAKKDHLANMTQVWTYNEALGRIQGMTPPAGYLLGRAWKQNKERGSSALERLAPVEHDHVVSKTTPLKDIVTKAHAWIRDVRTNGASWQVLPKPTHPELRPNLRATRDAPWHGARRGIARTLEDLTIIPRVNPELRNAAMATGLNTWTDSACTATACGITAPSYAAQVDANIDANHSPADGPIVFPSYIQAGEDTWRHPAKVEFYLDFETVNDVDDDFSKFPEKNGCPMIFMVGCGHVDADGSWQFKVFTADRLDHGEEARILDAWIDHMESVCSASGDSLADARLYHWHSAETSSLVTAYNAALQRNPSRAWADLEWFDLLNRVARAQPIGVKDAWGFGLKAIAKAMHKHGLIETSWADGPTDGLGAMVGAWWCNGQARERGDSMRDHELMVEIERYNEVDCKVMWEILAWLRRNR